MYTSAIFKKITSSVIRVIIYKHSIAAGYYILHMLVVLNWIKIDWFIEKLKNILKRWYKELLTKLYLEELALEF